MVTQLIIIMQEHAKSNRNLDLKDFALENKNWSIVPTRNKHKLVTWYDKQLEIIVKITRTQVESRLFLSQVYK